MKDKRGIIKIILGICLGLSLILFVYLYQNTGYEVEEPIKTVEVLNDWSIEKSSINGAPLIENKNVYLGQEPGKIEKIYITVFPTEDSEGNMLSLSAFDLHTARNKNYNPLLNVNVQFGDENGGLPDINNLDQINGTIRVRGNSARGASYKSYKVKLKDGNDAFYGQSILNLNKHMYDVSKISNKFSMDIISSINNIASFRTNFMQVYIRDASLQEGESEFKYYGLYTHVEQPNKTYLRSRGLDENGNMYKATNFEFRKTPELKDVDDPTYSEEEFETILNIREGKNHTKLLEMLTNVNDLNLDFNEVFSKYFNEDNYLTWLACNILLGNEDIIAHNYIIYSPKNSLTWYLLPWDYDGSFKFGEYSSSFTAPMSLKGIQRLTGVLLHRRYLKQEGNLDKLIKKIDELMDSDFSKEKISFLINQYKSVLDTTMDIYPDVLISEIPPNEINDYIDQFGVQIQKNYENFLISNEFPSPIFVSEPEVTKQGKLNFNWEASYDYQGDLITYGITLAKDYDMEQIVFEENGLVDTTYTYEGELTPGIYYMRVTTTDEQDNTQISLDYYYDEDDSAYRFGTRQIIIE